MRAKKISTSAMWILMLLLVLGLGGFGVTNLGGRVTTVGSVGDVDIGVQEYQRALRAEVNAATAASGKPLTFAEAQAQGLPQRVLSRLISQAALEDETARMGISIGDETLRKQIVDIPGFQGVDGKFDRDGYRYALDRAGLNESEFEASVRKETASNLVQSAVISGINPPKAYTDTLMTYIAEERDVTYATLGRSDLTTGLPVPTDADLKTYYQSHLPSFTTPEVKRITYAWLTPEMVIDDVKIDEAALHEEYDARKAEFQQPERRLVERLVYPDAAAAKAARARLDAGEAGFDDLVKARGLTLTDIDLGDVAVDDLSTPAGKAVFAAASGDVVGPVDSNLGPALFRINAVLKAQTTTFEEAEPKLRDELAGDRAARVVDTSVEDIDNRLAGGATLEDLAKETKMQVGTIDWHPGLKEGIAGYTAFRAAAQQLKQDDYPEVTPLDDGGIFAMRLDKVVEPTVQPLDKVKDAVATGWAEDATLKALRAQAEATVKALQGGASFDDEGLIPETVKGVTRQGFHADTPAGFVNAVFGMEKAGDVTTLDGDAQLFILRLDKITPPDDTPDASDGNLAQIRDTVRSSAANDIAQDLYVALLENVRRRAGITLNQQAIDAVQANFQ